MNIIFAVGMALALFSMCAVMSPAMTGHKVSIKLNLLILFLVSAKLIDLGYEMNTGQSWVELSLLGVAAYLVVYLLWDKIRPYFFYTPRSMPDRRQGSRRPK
jgi:hypothetical protein